MPTYQYACVDCGEPLEVVQKFTDDPLTVCPTCTGRLRKVFSAVGVVFKGSGFYRTDSRAGQGSSERSGSNGDSKSADKAADSKSGAAKSGEGSSGSGSSSNGSGDGKAASKSSSSASGSDGSSSGSSSSAKKKSESAA